MVHTPTTMITFDMVILLVAAFAGGSVARRFGYPAAIGELLVGIVIRAPEILDKTQPIFLFLVPILFISIGMLIDPRAFLPSVVPGLFITSLAIIGKVVGCGGALLVSEYSTREPLTVGVGIIPRGEVGRIIAGIGD